MIVAFLRMTPLPETSSSSPQPLYSPCYLNGRRYLRLPPEPRYQSRSWKQPFGEQLLTFILEKSYIPSCISFAPILFPDLRALSRVGTDGTVTARSMLEEAYKITRSEYGKIKARKNMLPECVALYERLGEDMKCAFYQ